MGTKRGDSVETSQFNEQRQGNFRHRYLAQDNCLEIDWGDNQGACY